MRAGVCIVAFTLSFGSVSMLRAQVRTDPCGVGKERNEKETALRAEVNGVLKDIRSKSGFAILKLADDRGVWLSGGLLSVGEIKQEFRNKEGLYCLLFSTHCLASTKFPSDVHVDLSTYKVSYFEWLEKNGPKRIEIEMGYGGDEEPCTANVAIRTIEKPLVMPETLELGFDYRGDMWKFRRTPAWPVGISRLDDSGDQQKRFEARNGN